MPKAFLIKIPTKNNLPEPNYEPKKSDWLVCPSSPEILLVETAVSKNLMGC
jgi:hypothetical protein